MAVTVPKSTSTRRSSQVPSIDTDRGRRNSSHKSSKNPPSPRSPLGRSPLHASPPVIPPSSSNNSPRSSPLAQSTQSGAREPSMGKGQPSNIPDSIHASPSIVQAPYGFINTPPRSAPVAYSPGPQYSQVIQPLQPVYHPRNMPLSHLHQPPTNTVNPFSSPAYQVNSMPIQDPGSNMGNFLISGGGSDSEDDDNDDLTRTPVSSYKDNIPAPIAKPSSDSHGYPMVRNGSGSLEDGNSAVQRYNYQQQQQLPQPRQVYSPAPPQPVYGGEESHSGIFPGRDTSRVSVEGRHRSAQLSHNMNQIQSMSSPYGQQSGYFDRQPSSRAPPPIQIASNMFAGAPMPSPALMAPVRKPSTMEEDQKSMMEERVIIRGRDRGEDRTTKFFNRLSYAVRHENTGGNRTKNEESHWLTKTQGGNRRMKITVWCIGILICVIVAASIGGYYATKKSTTNSTSTSTNTTIGSSVLKRDHLVALKIEDLFNGYPEVFQGRMMEFAGSGDEREQ